jgi:hypothetical protein
MGKGQWWRPAFVLSKFAVLVASKGLPAPVTERKKPRIGSPLNANTPVSILPDASFSSSSSCARRRSAASRSLVSALRARSADDLASYSGQPRVWPVQGLDWR